MKISRLQALIAGEPARIGIYRGQGIGDVIMTTPAIHAIKKNLPNCHITYATDANYLDGALGNVLHLNPDIDQIVDRASFKENECDVYLNLHCPCTAYERNGYPPINRIDIFAREVGVGLADPRPRYFLSKKESEYGEKILGPILNETLVMVQPSASNQRRSFSHRKLKEALVMIGRVKPAKFIILTHGSDFQTDVLWDNIPGAVVLRNLGIREIAAVMAYCSLVVCPDSSILHLAGALDVPTVALFGPTDPRARINHYPKATAIWHGDKMLACPCWWESTCLLGNACWETITSTEVAKTCVDHLHNYEKKEGLIKTRII